MAKTINGKPWDQQAFFNESMATDITGSTTDGSIPANTRYGPMVATNGRVYLLTSIDGTTVRTASIDSSGNLGSWSTVSTSLPSIAFSNAIITSSRAYIIGGRISGSESNKLHYAAISPDGTLGTWYEDSVTLPTAMESITCFIVNRKLYVFGAQGYEKLYVASIDSSGIVGSFSDSGKDIPAPYHNACSVAVTSSRVYLLGGESSGLPDDAVHYATYDSDGVLGTWTSGTALPSDRSTAACIVIKNYVFLISGYGTGNTPISSVTGAPIDSSGVIGSWATKTSWATAIPYFKALVTSSKVYLLGGGNTTIYSASFSGGTNNYLPYAYEIEGTAGVGSVVTAPLSINGHGGNYGYIEQAMPFTGLGYGGGYGSATLPAVTYDSLGSELIIGTGAYQVPRIMAVAYANTPNPGNCSYLLRNVSVTGVCGGSGGISYGFSFAGAGDSENVGTGSFISPALSYLATGQVGTVGDGDYRVSQLSVSGVGISGTVGTGAYLLKAPSYVGISTIHGPNTGDVRLTNISLNAIDRRVIDDTVLEFIRDTCTFSHGTLDDAATFTSMKYSRIICQP